LGAGFSLRSISVHQPSNTSLHDGHAKIEVDIARNWEHFDRLPKIVRDAINEMPVEFSVEQIAEEYWQLKREYFISDYEYARHLSSNFRAFVQHESYTKAEKPPYEYRIKARPRRKIVSLYGGPGTPRTGVHR
jgi:hypothetical protein